MSSEPNVELDCFDTTTNTLPNGQPRCEFRSRFGNADDPEETWEPWKRCTRPATTVVQITDDDQNVSTARVCDECNKEWFTEDDDGLSLYALLRGRRRGAISRSVFCGTGQMQDRAEEAEAIIAREQAEIDKLKKAAQALKTWMDRGLRTGRLKYRPRPN